MSEINRPKYNQVRGLLPSMLNQIRRYTPAITIVSIVLIILWKLVFTNLILGRGDTLLYIYPYWEHRARVLLSGQIPLWNPYIFMGSPFLANPQAGVLYPPNWFITPFSTTNAVKIAIVTHLWIAAFGTYKLALHSLGISKSAAVVAALLFALGGHMTAKVEQVNQLQALAWLPWILLAAHKMIHSIKTHNNLVRSGLILSILIGLQLLSGHTQSSFISMFSVIVWCCTAATCRITHISSRKTDLWWMIAKTNVYVLIPIIVCIISAVLLAAAQIIPALELSQLSLRSDGLSMREALSFSVHPKMLGYVLLPAFVRPVFNELIGYLGIPALMLAILGCYQISHKPNQRLMLPALAIALIGITLAMGSYNPMYWLLTKFAPGFNLFRVPARWLVLWALGAALLAGYGYESLKTRSYKPNTPQVTLTLLLVSVLITLNYLTTNYTPPGETGPLPRPDSSDLYYWTFILIISVLIIRLKLTNLRTTLLILLIFAELGLASLTLPINKLTTPDAYYDTRPPMTPLLMHRNSNAHNGRVLSYSSLLFDPGDLDMLRHRLAKTLSVEATQLAIDAAKSKSVLSPNLSQTWQIPSIDGYDGGILPIRAYAQFFSRLLPNMTVSEDGRMREKIKNTPPNWILNITNTRWLITDKLNDVWLDNIFYDLQMQIDLKPFESTIIPTSSDFQATSIGLIIESPQSEDESLGNVYITQKNDNVHSIPIPSNTTSRIIHLQMIEPIHIKSIEIKSANNNLKINGAALIDERANTFVTLTLGPYRLAHSGDVKVYENLNVLPLAYMVKKLPLDRDTKPIGGTTIQNYSTNEISIDTNSTEPSTLILAQTSYPGWQATIDGKPTNIFNTNGLFSAIELEAGTHRVVFQYKPRSWQLGLWISITTLILWALAFRFTQKNVYP